MRHMTICDASEGKNTARAPQSHLPAESESRAAAREVRGEIREQRDDLHDGRNEGADRRADLGISSVELPELGSLRRWRRTA